MPQIGLVALHCARAGAATLRIVRMLFICCALPCAAMAGDKAADQALIDSVNTSLVEAGQAYRANKTAEAAKAFAAAQATFATIDLSTIDPALKTTFERLGERLAAAERLIKKSAANTPGDKPTRGPTKAPVKPGSTPAKTPAKSDAKPEDKTEPKPTRASTKPGKGRKAAPSFCDEVAPILIAKCGGCHVKGNRGGLSMATFTSFARGGKNGAAVRPGDSNASLLIGAIVSGKMPQGNGPKVTQEELRTLAAWIDAGASFDGEDRDSPLGQKTSVAPVMVEGLAPATGQESVQFNRDLANTLVAHCAGCHGGDTPSGQLRLETFADLLKGGASGKPIEPGKPDESLLALRMRGEDGDRMPLDKPALPEATIAQFETWIKEGAKYDGADPARSLKLVVEDLEAGRLSHDELAEKRLAQALKTWRLGAPDEQPTHRQTANFIVVGNLSETRLGQLADAAEAERAKIGRWLKLPDDKPWFKGNLVLFVFKRGFDYSEFVQMVEKREVPRGATGHWHNLGLEAYACVIASNESDADLPALLAEQISGAYLQSLEAPPWFSAGAARAIASRMEPKSALVKQWDQESVTATAEKMTDGILKAKVLDGETTSRCYSFARFLMTSQPRFQSLLTSLTEGDAFAPTLQKVYGASAQGLLEAFSRRPPPRSRR